jgi:hypothetical protein
LIVRGLDRRVGRVTLLGNGKPLEFDQHRGHLEGGALRATLPEAWLDPLDTVVKLQFED